MYPPPGLLLATDGSLPLYTWQLHLREQIWLAELSFISAFGVSVVRSKILGRHNISNVQHLVSHDAEDYEPSGKPTDSHIEGFIIEDMPYYLILGKMHVDFMQIFKCNEQVPRSSAFWHDNHCLVVEFRGLKGRDDLAQRTVTDQETSDPTHDVIVHYVALRPGLYPLLRKYAIVMSVQLPWEHMLTSCLSIRDTVRLSRIIGTNRSNEFRQCDKPEWRPAPKSSCNFDFLLLRTIQLFSSGYKGILFALLDSSHYFFAWVSSP